MYGDPLQAPWISFAIAHFTKATREVIWENFGEETALGDMFRLFECFMIVHPSPRIMMNKTNRINLYTTNEFHIMIDSTQYTNWCLDCSKPKTKDSSTSATFILNKT